MEPFAPQYEHYDEVTLTSSGVPIVLSRYHSGEDDPVVIFLPGTMVHPLFYDSFLSKLARSGFNVVGIHFISHGKSPRIREDFTIYDLMQNVRDTIDFCSGHYEGELFLLGSSQGGIVATAVADDPRLKAVLAHDTILPELDETVQLLNLPPLLHTVAKPLLALFKAAAFVAPKFQLPLTAYLDAKRLTASQKTFVRYMDDPLCRKSYPLCFLSSLFFVDMHVATDGSMACPYVLIAAKEEKLFPFSYVEKVFEKIVAPQKELLAFDLEQHVIFVEAEETVLGPVVGRLKRFGASAEKP